MSEIICIIATIEWLTEEFLPHGQRNRPKGPLTATAGYRESKGPGDLFSVVLRYLNGDSDDRTTCSLVELSALVPEMNSRLPRPGERLVVTSGHTPVAVCTALQPKTT